MMILQILGLVLLIQLSSVHAQNCNGSTTPLINEAQLQTFQSCQQIDGDLILGMRDCSSVCSIQDLSSLINIRTITGSFVIQCCNSMTSIPNLLNLNEIKGTFRIYYNSMLRTVDGTTGLNAVGNLEIAQNRVLQSITGLQSLLKVSGYLSIERNPILTGITGLNNLITIQGEDLVNDHALAILYNHVLTDISGFESLASIAFGTVHIEGNTALCYSGYPLWNYGSYGKRYSSGDMGIDWRTILSTIWQYSWEDGTGVPSLVIQDNGNQSICASASCDSSCPSGAGCLGPGNSELCGRCYITSDINSCDTVSPPDSESSAGDCVDWWPPTQQPFSVIFGIFFVVLGVIVLVILIVIFIAVWKLYRCFHDSQKGSYNIVQMPDERTVKKSLDNTPQIKKKESVTNERRSIGVEKQSRTGSSVASTPSVQISSHRKPDGHVESVVAYTSTHEASPGYFRNPLRDSENVQSLQKPSIVKVERKLEEEEEVSVKDEENEKEEEEPVEEEWTDNDDSFSDSDKEEFDEIDEMMDFPSDNIRLIRQIGQGTFGKVFEADATSLLDNEEVTHVVVKQSHDDATEEELEIFLQPAEAMRQLKHENVLALLGVSIDGSNVMIILEYCNNGNLKTFLKKKELQSSRYKQEGTIHQIIVDFATGLQYLHSMEIAHNDFAARNCLVTHDHRVKVGDYGYSRTTFKGDYYTRTPGQIAWPIRWMAPEIILDRGDGILDSLPATEPSNVWSFGITLWEVCSFGEQPYSNMTDEEVIELMNKNGRCYLKNPVYSSDPLHSFYIIMKHCWKLEANRPTMNEVLEQVQSAKNKFKPTKYRDSRPVSGVQMKPKRPAPSKPPDLKQWRRLEVEELDGKEKEVREEATEETKERENQVKKEVKAREKRMEKEVKEREVRETDMKEEMQEKELKVTQPAQMDLVTKELQKKLESTFKGEEEMEDVKQDKQRKEVTKKKKERVSKIVTKKQETKQTDELSWDEEEEGEIEAPPPPHPSVSFPHEDNWDENTSENSTDETDGTMHPIPGFLPPPDDFSQPEYEEANEKEATEKEQTDQYKIEDDWEEFEPNDEPLSLDFLSTQKVNNSSVDSLSNSQKDKKRTKNEKGKKKDKKTKEKSKGKRKSLAEQEENDDNAIVY